MIALDIMKAIRFGLNDIRSYIIYAIRKMIPANRTWAGNCFGMSASSVLFYKGVMQEEMYDKNVHVPYDFTAPSTDSSLHMKLKRMIGLIQLFCATVHPEIFPLFVR